MGIRNSVIFAIFSDKNFCQKQKKKIAKKNIYKGAESEINSVIKTGMKNNRYNKERSAS